jgi:hypothetical protein
MVTNPSRGGGELGRLCIAVHGRAAAVVGWRRTSWPRIGGPVLIAGGGGGQAALGHQQAGVAFRSESWSAWGGGAAGADAMFRFESVLTCIGLPTHGK